MGTWWNSAERSALGETRKGVSRTRKTLVRATFKKSYIPITDRYIIYVLPTCLKLHILVQKWIRSRSSIFLFGLCLLVEDGE